MSNDFFDNHPLLGGMFDFNRDGSLNLGEAGAMAAMGSMAATEFMRATKESEREWDDDPISWKKTKKKSKKYDYDFDDDFVEYDEDRVYEIDTSDADEIMEAIISGDFDEADVEYLVYEALYNDVEFSRDDLEEILDYVRDRNLKDRIRNLLG